MQPSAASLGSKSQRERQRGNGQEDEFSTTVGDTVKSYDGWGNLTKFEQDADSAIGAGAGRDEFEIAYTYQKATPTGGRPMVRRTGMTSTAGADITYEVSGAPIPPPQIGGERCANPTPHTGGG